MGTMKAVVQRGIGGPDAMALEKVPRPPAPVSDQVLVRIEAAGVCYHDVLVRDGIFRQLVELPVIPGHEIAGVIEAVGDEVLDLRVGDRVASTNRETCGQCRWCRTKHEPECERQGFFGHNVPGGYAEYVVARENAFARVPSSMPAEAAAILSCAVATEMHALHAIGGLRSGETVVITGAGGGLGVHGVQLARAAGARVIAVTTSPSKVETLYGFGADEVLVVGRDGERFDKQLRAVAPRGVDLVCDNVGEPVFRSCFPALAVDGRYVFVGQLTANEVSFNPAWLLIHETRLMGSRSNTRAELEDVVRMVESGQVKPVIEATMPLEEFAAAHERLTQSSMTGRLVLVP